MVRTKNARVESVRYPPGPHSATSRLNLRADERWREAVAKHPKDAAALFYLGKLNLNYVVSNSARSGIAPAGTSTGKRATSRRLAGAGADLQTRPRRSCLD